MRNTISLIPLLALTAWAAAGEAPTLVLRLGGDPAAAAADASAGHLVLALAGDAAGRTALLQAKTRVPEALTVVAQDRWESLPMATDTVDRIEVSWPEATRRGLTMSELLRVLAPVTGRALVSGLTPAEATRLAAGAAMSVKPAATGVELVRPAPPGWDTWQAVTRADASGRSISVETVMPKRNTVFGTNYSGPSDEAPNTLESNSQCMWLRWVDSDPDFNNKFRRSPFLIADGLMVHATKLDLGRRMSAEAKPIGGNDEVGIACRSAANGLLRWQRQGEAPLVLSGDQVLVRSGRTNLIAVALADGQTRWSIPGILDGGVSGKEFGSDVAVAAGLLVTADKRAATGFAWKDGKQRWREEGAHQGCWIEGGSVLLARGQEERKVPAFSSVGRPAPDGIAVVAAEDGRERWHRSPADLGANGPDKSYQLGVIGLRKGVAIVIVDHRRIIALRADTGAEAWHYDLDEVPGQRDRGGIGVQLMQDRVLAQINNHPHFLGKGVKAPFPYRAMTLDLATGAPTRITSPDFHGAGVGTWACNAGGISEGMIDLAMGVRPPPPPAPDWVGSFPIQAGCGLPAPLAWGLAWQTRNYCACDFNKPQGLLTTAPVELARLPAKPAPGAVEHGPAWGRPLAAADTPGWRMFRGDEQRSASAKQPVGLRLKWQVTLSAPLPAADGLGASWFDQPHFPGPITAPVAADGVAVVALPLQRTVVAMDFATGKERWRHTVDGVIDSPPTLVRGRCVFGSRDGRLHALDLADGAVVWSLRLAPIDERIPSHGTLEGRYPVVGAVLPRGDAVIATAGQHGMMGIFWAEVALADGTVRSFTKVSRRVLYNDALVVDAAGAVRLGAATLDSPPRPPGRKDAYHKDLMPGLLRKVPTDEDSHLVPLSGELIGCQRSTYPDRVAVTMLGAQRGDAWAWRGDQAFGIVSGGFPEGRYITTKKGEPAHQLFSATRPAQGVIALTALRWMTPMPGEAWALLLADNDLVAAGRKTPDPKIPLSRIASPGWIGLFDPANGKERARVDLATPPVPDGLALSDGVLLVSTWDGRLTAFAK